MSETKKFKCTGCGEDRPCLVETNQGPNESAEDIIEEFKCILDSTNQTSFNWVEVPVNSKDLSVVNNFIEGLVKLKADGLLEAFIACEQDNILKIKELLEL